MHTCGSNVNNTLVVVLTSVNRVLSVVVIVMKKVNVSCINQELSKLLFDFRLYIRRVLKFIAVTNPVAIFVRGSLTEIGVHMSLPMQSSPNPILRGNFSF